MTAGEIASLVGGTLHGDAAAEIEGVAPLASAERDELSFVADRSYLPYVAATRAGVLLAPARFAEAMAEAGTWIAVDDPHLAMAEVLDQLHPPPAARAGIHETASVSPAAAVHDSAWVGAYSVVEEHAVIEAGVQIGSHCSVGEGSHVGRNSILHPHVTVYRFSRVGARCVLHSGARIGADGFGFASSESGHRKVPQVGRCVIGDDVEIGANTTIDRGSIGDTVIGEGTKIDNLVHVGHNVQIGKHVLIIAQVGISGSCTIGDGAVLAGQAGIGGHLTIGAGARVAGQAGVIGDVPAGETVSGYPARPHREALRAQAAVFRLPALMRRLNRVATHEMERDDGK